MSYPTHNKYKVDVLWFRNQLERAGLSSNGFAAKLGTHNSVVSRKLTGKQKLTYDDAVAMAKVLGCSVSDIMRAGNVEAHALPAAPSLGRVDAQGELHAFDIKPKVSGQRHEVSIEVPLPGMLHHMLVPILLTPTDLATMRGTVLGVAILADGRKLLRTVRQGSIAGRYDLLPALGLGARENDVELLRLHSMAPTMLS